MGRHSVKVHVGGAERIEPELLSEVQQKPLELEIKAYISRETTGDPLGVSQQGLTVLGAAARKIKTSEHRDDQRKSGPCRGSTVRRLNLCRQCRGKVGAFSHGQESWVCGLGH